MIGLIGEMEENCIIMEKRRVQNEFGGIETVWTDGVIIKAAIVKDSTLAARVAEKEGVTELYTITVPKGTPLGFHDVLKRENGGEIFRITSNIKDKQTPALATFQIGVVTAERWELT